MSKSKPRTVPLLGELSTKMAALRKIERAIDGMSPVDAASVLWDAYSAASKQSSKIGRAHV